MLCENEAHNTLATNWIPGFAAATCTISIVLPKPPDFRGYKPKDMFKGPRRSHCNPVNHIFMVPTTWVEGGARAQSREQRDGSRGTV